MPGEGWVHEIQGWPPMCEARQRGAEELLAASEVMCMLV